MNELTKIDLNQAQVLQRTREALSQLIEGWEMGYDDEPRDEVRLVASLLDLMWEQSPEGIAHAEEIAKREEEMRKHNDLIDAELASEAHRDALAQEAEEMRLHNESIDAERQYAEDQDIEEAREAALKASDGYRDSFDLAKEVK